MSVESGTAAVRRLMRKATNAMGFALQNAHNDRVVIRREDEAADAERAACAELDSIDAELARLRAVAEEAHGLIEAMRKVGDEPTCRACPPASEAEDRMWEGYFSLAKLLAEQS